MHTDSSPDSRSTAGRILRRVLVLLVRAVLVIVLLWVLLTVLVVWLPGGGCGCDQDPTAATPLAGQENVLESPKRQEGRDHSDVRAGVADSGAEDWRQTHAHVEVTEDVEALG